MDWIQSDKTLIFLKKVSLCAHKISRFPHRAFGNSSQTREGIEDKITKIIIFLGPVGVYSQDSLFSLYSPVRMCAHVIESTCTLWPQPPPRGPIIFYHLLSLLSTQNQKPTKKLARKRWEVETRTVGWCHGLSGTHGEVRITCFSHNYYPVSLTPVRKTSQARHTLAEICGRVIQVEHEVWG